MKIMNYICFLISLSVFLISSAQAVDLDQVARIVNSPAVKEGLKAKAKAEFAELNQYRFQSLLLKVAQKDEPADVHGVLPNLCLHLRWDAQAGMIDLRDLNWQTCD